MILVEYFRSMVSYIDSAEKMYINTSNIQYITYTYYGTSKHIVVGVNGESFTLSTESGNDLLYRMGLSKEDLLL